MREYDPSKDALGLGNFNAPLKQELIEVIQHMSNTFNHVTTEDRNNWDNKLDVETGAVATEIANGLLSKEDKAKLNTVAHNANFYQHPESGIIPGTYNTIEVDKFGHVISARNEQSIGDAYSLGGAPSTDYAKLLSPLFTGTPMITNTPNEDDDRAIANVRFVKAYLANKLEDTYGITEEQINAWTNKYGPDNYPTATTTADGFMSASDKALFDQMVNNPATNLTQEQIAAWNNKVSLDQIPLATIESDGLMSVADKKTVESFKTLGTITAEDISNWNNKLDVATGAVATSESNGLMSSADKVRLDNLSAFATINQAKIDEWDAKWDSNTAPLVNQDDPGIMSPQDKFKLDNLPSITQEDVNAWNAKQEALYPATTSSNGIMTSIDKQDISTLKSNVESLTDRMVAVEGAQGVGVVTDESNGLMSSLDKSNLDTLWLEHQNGGGNLTAQELTDVREIIFKYDGSDKVAVTQSQVDSWNTKQDAVSEATASTSGLMPAADKAILDSIINSDGGFNFAVVDNRQEIVPGEYNEETGEYGEETINQIGDGSSSSISMGYTGTSIEFSDNSANVYSEINFAKSEDGNPLTIKTISTNENTENGTYLTSTKNGLFYSKTKQDATAAGKEVVVKDDIETLSTNVADAMNVVSKIYNKNTGYFETTYTQSNGSYAKLWNESDGGGSQFFNKGRNILAYVGVNQSTESDPIDVQIYAKDKTTNIGTRINISSSGGMFYLKNCKNLGLPAGREVAVIDDINAAKEDMVPKADYDALLERVDELEAQVTQLIDQYTTPENTEPTEPENTEPTEPENTDTPTDPENGENTNTDDPENGENTEPTEPENGENTEPTEPENGDEQPDDDV